MRHCIEIFKRMEAIFHEALELPDGERAIQIAVRCDGDTTLMDEVHALLEASKVTDQLSASYRNQQQ